MKAPSLLLAALVAVAALLWIGKEFYEATRHDFQVIQLGDMRRDHFLLDRRTGRVWNRVCSGAVKGSDCDGMLYWDEMYVEGVTPEESSAAKSFRSHILSRFQKDQPRKRFVPDP